MMPPSRGLRDVLGYRKVNLLDVLRLQHTKKSPDQTGLAGADGLRRQGGLNSFDTLIVIRSIHHPKRHFLDWPKEEAPADGGDGGGIVGGRPNGQAGLRTIPG
jgi:hypothetical protein